MSIIIFIIILAVLVFVHELGHFLIAKWNGIRVDEFGLGFPPKIWSKKVGETEYSINWIPFGGFVKIFGENPYADDGAELSKKDKQTNLLYKSKWTQARVLFGGVFYNFLFAWLLIVIAFTIGVPQAITDDFTGDTKVIITNVVPESPVAASDLQIGDEIIVLVAGADHVTIEEPEQIGVFVSAHQDDEIIIVADRGGEKVGAKLTPMEGLAEDKRVIGLISNQVGFVQLNPFVAIWEGLKHSIDLTIAVAIGLAVFIGQAITGVADYSQVAGPVGIVDLVGNVSGLGLAYLLSFTAFISINLAVINLIPIPALDGGRLLFLIIEYFKGSRIKPKT